MSLLLDTCALIWLGNGDPAYRFFKVVVEGP